MSKCRCASGWICEQHPWSAWPHDSCAGPSIPCGEPSCPYRKGDTPHAAQLDDWPPPPLEPKTFRQQCWRMVGPSNKVLSCHIVRIQTGLEVRMGYSDDDVLRTQLTPDLGTARAVAGEMKAIVCAMGSFLDLDSAS
jgi:hypothetical protein